MAKLDYLVSIICDSGSQNLKNYRGISRTVPGDQDLIEVELLSFDGQSMGRENVKTGEFDDSEIPWIKERLDSLGKEGSSSPRFQNADVVVKLEKMYLEHGTEVLGDCEVVVILLLSDDKLDESLLTANIDTLEYHRNYILNKIGGWNTAPKDLTDQIHAIEKELKKRGPYSSGRWIVVLANR